MCRRTTSCVQPRRRGGPPRATSSANIRSRWVRRPRRGSKRTSFLKLRPAVPTRSARAADHIVKARVIEEAMRMGGRQGYSFEQRCDCPPVRGKLHMSGARLSVAPSRRQHEACDRRRRAQTYGDPRTEINAGRSRRSRRPEPLPRATGPRKGGSPRQNVQSSLLHNQGYNITHVAGMHNYQHLRMESVSPSHGAWLLPWPMLHSTRRYILDHATIHCRGSSTATRDSNN